MCVATPEYESFEHGSQKRTYTRLNVDFLLKVIA